MGLGLGRAPTHVQAEDGDQPRVGRAVHERVVLVRVRMRVRARVRVRMRVRASMRASMSGLSWLGVVTILTVRVRVRVRVRVSPNLVGRGDDLDGAVLGHREPRPARAWLG